MPKETFYFSHDYNARGDRRMVNLLMKCGVAGIGIYWSIVEMLYEERGYLMLTECERIAFELRTDANAVLAVIESSLFEKDEEKFWSDSVLRRLNKRNEKTIKARESAILRWENETAMRSHSDGNANKVKKSKVNNNNSTNGRPPNLPPEILEKAVYNCEEYILSNPIEFERICMVTKKSPDSAKESLRKYHLWHVENEKYPKGKKACVAGFEKWLLSEKNFYKNVAHQSPPHSNNHQQAGDKSTQRTNAIANIGLAHRSGDNKGQASV
jgi:hypothetical protein